MQWKRIPVDTPVAMSRTRQLSQIRQLARKFKAHTLSLDQQRWQLRLLPRPLHEYTTQEGDSQRAGAVIALLQGMDPELILVIEARAAEDGIAWHYACGSFTDYETHLSFGNREIWSAPATPREDALSPKKAYWRGYITKRALPPESERGTTAGK